MKRLAAAGLLMLAACSTGSRADQPVLVFAAASLSEAFTAVAAAYDGAVRFSFGPSDGLATQIREGAPADVYATASPRWMDAVAADPGVRERTTFARNELVVIVPVRNAARVFGLTEVARPGVKLVLAAEGVPAGEYARRLLERAGLLASALRNLVSNEEDVKGVVAKVLLDEADAGLVYRTDLTPEVLERVRAFEIPAAHQVEAEYQIAVVAGTPLPAAAAAFVEHVLGPGRAVLVRHGFLTP